MDKELIDRAINQYHEVVGNLVFRSPEKCAKYWFENKKVPGTHNDWYGLDANARKFYVMLVRYIWQEQRKENDKNPS